MCVVNCKCDVILMFVLSGATCLCAIWKLLCLYLKPCAYVELLLPCVCMLSTVDKHLICSTMYVEHGSKIVYQI